MMKKHSRFNFCRMGETKTFFILSFLSKMSEKKTTIPVCGLLQKHPFSEISQRFDEGGLKCKVSKSSLKRQLIFEKEKCFHVRYYTR